MLNSRRGNYEEMNETRLAKDWPTRSTIALCWIRAPAMNLGEYGVSVDVHPFDNSQ
jgi:hypothetical protein